jgi:predicted amidohydrolase YtcJ
MASTFFGGGTIWTGVEGQTTDAFLVVDGGVAAVGERARERAATTAGLWARHDDE